jgi:3'-phosphoadenosine 5'-phosphosulfate sulfotransferase (PAPS reductase)/FAD synthetase
MLRILLDEMRDFAKRFIILFCNTGKERNATLDFVREMQNRWGVEVIWLEYTRVPAIEIDPMVYPHPKSQKTVREQQEKGLDTHWFRVVNYETARRNGTRGPFDELLDWANVLPNIQARYCTVQMKVRTMMRYMFSLGCYEWVDHIGIRADEAHRALEIKANAPKYRPAVFPLISRGVTEKDVTRFWQGQDFDLQLQPHEGNCDLCFLKAKHKRLMLMRDNPGMADWWIEKERVFAGKATGDGAFFRIGQGYAKLLRKSVGFVHEEQTGLDFDIPCGCGDKGFVLNETENYEL